MSRSTPSCVARDVARPRCIASSPRRTAAAARRSDRADGSVLQHERAGRRRDTQRGSLVVVRVQPGRFEYESPCTALCHRVQDPVTIGIDLRAIDEQYVERRPRARRRGRARRADRRVVARLHGQPPSPRARKNSIEHSSISTTTTLPDRLRLDRPPLHDAVEDRILGRVQRARVRPIPAEPPDRAEREQWIERKLQPTSRTTRTAADSCVRPCSMTSRSHRQATPASRRSRTADGLLFLRPLPVLVDRICPAGGLHRHRGRQTLRQVA